MNTLASIKFKTWRFFDRLNLKLTQGPQKPGTKSPIKNIRPYLFKANLKINEWESAIQMAEDPNNPNRLQLYMLYKEAMRDPRLFSFIDTRIKRTTGTPFSIVDDAGFEDPELIKLFQKPWFYKTIKWALESRFFGHSLIEFQNPVKVDDSDIKYQVKANCLIPREHVLPNRGELLVYATDLTGIPYRENPEFNLIEFGEPDDLGMLCPLVREIIYKYYSRSDWSRASEKFGMPLLALATDGMNDTEIDKMENMAQNFGTNSYVIVDSLDRVQMLYPNNNGDMHKIYSEKIKYADDQMAILTTGGTAMQAEKSFVGSSETQERTMGEIVEDDRAWLAMQINETLMPFLSQRFGYPLKGMKFQFVELNPVADAEKPGNQKPTPPQAPGGRSGKKPKA